MTEDDVPPTTPVEPTPEAPAPAPSDPPAAAVDRELRCGAVRYGVICTLPATHDGMHRHDPGDERMQLSWLRDP